jgi:hypothetical protein
MDQQEQLLNWAIGPNGGTKELSGSVRRIIVMRCDAVNKKSLRTLEEFR